MMSTLLAEYRELELQRRNTIYAMDTDPTLNIQFKKLQELEIKREEFVKSILERKKEFNVSEIEKRQAEIREQISNEWPVEGKTYNSEIATVTLRITKSLIITSKEKVVNFLTKNDKITEAILKFDLRVLRKFKDAGLMNDCVDYEEKKSVQVILNEA